MPSYVTPKKNTAYIFYAGLVDQANTKLLKAAPTLAAGDFKVSIDGGAFANLATLPTVTPAGGTAVKISLSAAEMNGDNIVVTCIDAAGAEWCDQLINLQTSARQIDDLTFPAVSGRSLAVDASGNVTASLAVRLKTNQALANYHFVMTDSTTHNPATGKAVTVTRVIDGGTFAGGTLGAVTEIANGLYRLDIPAADLNGAIVTLKASASGCDDTMITLTLEP